MLTRKRKEEEVGYIVDGINCSQITICVDYLGLTVEQVNDMRSQLKESGCDARVFKNTLSKLAASEALKDSDAEDLNKFVDMFNGPSLIVFGREEAVAPAKVIAKFAKDIEHFEIKGAWFSGSYIDPKGVEAVAKMPSREETLAKLLSLLNTPATQLLRIMNAPAQQLAQVLGAHQQKLAA